MQNTQAQGGHVIVIIGAGPAGLYATQALLRAGAYVVLVNRDIKPGGLAEYGIFPTKQKMKAGLRKQFRTILAHPHVDYYGNVAVGDQGDLTVADLRSMGCDALIVATGAQGTKSLGIPGEDAAGVIHAKELVYHYNHLPPFSQRHLPLGKRVAIIGMGNVMIDIAHYLLRLWQRVEEVVVVARRGPAERKYDAREYRYVEPFVDQVALRQELVRLRPRLEAVGQDVEALIAAMASNNTWQPAAGYPGRMTFRFLASPRRVLTNTDGRVRGLELEENILVAQNSSLAARGTGILVELPVDTVIYAIGDCVDGSLGLPHARGAFVTNLSPAATHPAAMYQVYDPVRQQVVERTYVIGWARQASDGLVGKARQDAETGVKAVLQELAHLPVSSTATVAEHRQVIHRLLEERSTFLMTKDDLTLLHQVEQHRAEDTGQADSTFETNEAMIQAVESCRRAGAPRCRHGR